MAKKRASASTREAAITLTRQAADATMPSLGINARDLSWEASG